MFFDGDFSSMGAGVGVIFVSPCHETISLSYRMEFEVTNNVAEYEALVLGLKAAKEMGIKEMDVFGDAEPIVQQVKNVYQTKNPRLRNYRNEVWDLVDDSFLDFNISYIPREENASTDCLDFTTSVLKVPTPPTAGSDVEIKYRPSIPDNIKHWRVFEDDQELRNFSSPLMTFPQCT
jgi:ribonuclease HI